MHLTIHHYHHAAQDPEVVRLLSTIQHQNNLILERMETIMTAIDDLKTAIAALIAEGTSDIASLVTQINSQVNQDPAIIALTTQVTEAMQTMHQAFTGATGVALPPPTTPVIPTDAADTPSA